MKSWPGAPVCLRAIPASRLTKIEAPTLGQESRPQGLESFSQLVNKYVLKPYDVPSTGLSAGEAEIGMVLCLLRGRQVLNRRMRIHNHYSVAVVIGPTWGKTAWRGKWAHPHATVRGKQGGLL